MKRDVFVLMSLALTCAFARDARAASTEFTYQGRLVKNGSEVNATCDFTFGLLDAPAGGAHQGTSPQGPTPVAVSDGLFTVLLDFGPDTFPGDPRWLSVAVQCPGDATATVLSPRQEVTPAPQAIYAETSSRAVGDFRVENGSGARVVFGDGPGDDCSIGVDSTGASGLNLKDPSGVRICRPPTAPPGATRLLFGPTDDCSIAIDTAAPSGLNLKDPIGVRICPPPVIPPAASRLIFGNDPDNLCAIVADPTGPSGLQLRDPGGIRIRNIGSSGQDGLARVIFGPTDDCSIEAGPTIGLTGLRLKDPAGVRVLSGSTTATIRFGPTDDCSIGIDSAGASGLNLKDPTGVRICRPPTAPPGPTTLRFGPTDDCSIGIDPAITGLVERDPIGFRLLGPGPGGTGCRLLFGPTDDCTVSVDPGGPAGLNLRDPSGVRILQPPGQTGPARLLFGPTDDCSISNIGSSGQDGVTIRDINGVRLENPQPMLPTRLLFGPTDDCSLGIDPAITGLVERDPVGLRLLGSSGEDGRLLFGPTDLCTIRVEPPTSTLKGMRFRDPMGFAFEQGNVAIGVPNATFRVELPNVAGPQGQGFANAWINGSSRRWKENIRPIGDALRRIGQLQGVYYDWKPENGGKHDLGFIAEDVGRVLPEVVAWEEGGQDAKGINYDHLVALTVEGIKEQQKQIDSLRPENINEMRNELTALRRQVAALTMIVEDLQKKNPR